LERNIYIVEDNDDIRELVTYLFEIEGYVVTSFANATDFYTNSTKKLPDLFVLDVMLPDGNGMEICNRLKADQPTAHIPVLLMSANTSVTYIGKESRADDFISKPFDIDELIIRVNNLLAVGDKSFDNTSL
jgi:two-component system phosphate regulon response regulator PhoB